MKYIFNANTILIIILFGLTFNSCKKEEVPTVITSEITIITGTTAKGGGTITDEGTGTVVERGICWSKSITPTITDKRTIEGGGAGTFTSNMDNLDGATTYYVRSYAKNEAGIGYGMAMSFKTLGQAPSTTTQSASDINTTSATLNGVVNANYLSSTVTFEYGMTANYGQTVTSTQSPVIGNSNTNVTAELSGLTAGTTYHFRLNTANSLGTTCGNDISFTTLGQLPTVSTLTATDITLNSANLNGTVNPNYLSTIVTFEYGTTTSYGIEKTATQSPVTGKSTISVSANVEGLSNGLTYHYRVKATNSLGTEYGSDNTFTTLAYLYLSQDFTDLGSYSIINTLPGWLTFAQAGNVLWKGWTLSGNNLARTTAFGSGEATVITWMITPQIDLSTASNPYIRFESRDGYDNGATLKLYVSIDYTGSSTPWTSTWTELVYTRPPVTSSGYSVFVSSGKVDLSTYNGSKIYIAWVYSGGVSSKTTTWDVDNVLIAGE
jgi:hypothetical protein